MNLPNPIREGIVRLAEERHQAGVSGADGQG